MEAPVTDSHPRLAPEAFAEMMRTLRAFAEAAGRTLTPLGASRPVAA